MPKHIYEARVRAISSNQPAVVYKEARSLYQKIQKKTKRRPYIRSAYFKKEKVFLESYWHHLYQKNWRDRVRRMKLFPCGVDLIENSHQAPQSKMNPRDSGEMLHRFSGRTPEEILFDVQIKEEIKTGNKWLMSTFPNEKDV